MGKIRLGFNRRSRLKYPVISINIKWSACVNFLNEFVLRSDFHIPSWYLHFNCFRAITKFIWFNSVFALMLVIERELYFTSKILILLQKYKRYFYINLWLFKINCNYVSTRGWIFIQVTKQQVKNYWNLGSLLML